MQNHKVKVAIPYAALEPLGISLDCFDQPFTLFGFNLSWWQVFLWSICGSIAAAFIGGMLR